MSERSPLLSLSNELLQEICSQLPNVPYKTFYQTSSGWKFCPNPAHRDLLNISLVCKRLSGAAKRYLGLTQQRFDLVRANGQPAIKSVEELEKFLQTRKASPKNTDSWKTLIVSFAHIPRTTQLSAEPRTPEELIDTMQKLEMFGRADRSILDFFASAQTETVTLPSGTTFNDRMLCAITRLLNDNKSIKHLELYERNREFAKAGETGLGLISLVLPTLKCLYSLSVSGDSDPSEDWHRSLLIRNILKIDSLRSLKITKAKWCGPAMSFPILQSKIKSRIEHLELHLCCITPSQMNDFISVLRFLQLFVFRVEYQYVYPYTERALEKLGARLFPRTCSARLHGFHAIKQWERPDKLPQLSIQ